MFDLVERSREDRQKIRGKKKEGKGREVERKDTMESMKRGI